MHMSFTQRLLTTHRLPIDLGLILIFYQTVTQGSVLPKKKDFLTAERRICLLLCLIRS